jgi:hypothetical protein
MLRFPESWQICQSADVTQPLEKLLPPLRNERRLATLEGVLSIIGAVIGTRHSFQQGGDRILAEASDDRKLRLGKD